MPIGNETSERLSGRLHGEIRSVCQVRSQVREVQSLEDYHGPGCQMSVPKPRRQNCPRLNAYSAGNAGQLNGIQNYARFCRSVVQFYRSFAFLHIRSIPKSSYAPQMISN